MQDFASASATKKMDENNRGSQHYEALTNYNVGITLGKGSFAKVKLAEHKLTGHKVAMKIISRDQIRAMQLEEKVNREIKILSMLIHPHIVRLYEVIYTPKNIFIVMEYCKFGDLFDYILNKGMLKEDEARQIFQQIISGVEYCQKNMVVHRDLKLENVLLDSKYNVKLADFGLSNVMHDGHLLRTSCGSPYYAAPEVISGKLYAGPEIDVWSCGVILYALLCGALPFYGSNLPNLLKKIEGGIYYLPTNLSALATDLISRMLVVDPTKRITICEIREHQWFQIRLPLYLAVPPPDTAHQAKMIDEETLQDVVKLGYDKEYLCESLCNRVRNEATVAYYLLLDNRFRATSGYLGAYYQEPMDRSFNYLAQSEAATSNTCHYRSSVTSRSDDPVERKCDVGFDFESRAHPREIMIEVLKALQELNVRWKTNGHYNMKCRWCPDQASDMMLDDRSINGDVSGRLHAVLKFEIQLYKTSDNKYLFDMQIVTGPQLLFLDLCAAFLTKVRAIASDMHGLPDSNV